MKILNKNLRKQVRFLPRINSLNSSYFPNSILKKQIFIKIFVSEVFYCIVDPPVYGASIALFKC